MIGIIHHIRRTAVRENIPVLPGSHLRPFPDRGRRIVAPELIIPDQTAKQTLVRGRNPIMTVQIQLGQRADVNAELLFLRNPAGQFLIQAVYSLDDDRLVLPDRSDPMPEFLPPGQEIETGKVDCFPRHEVIHIPAEQLRVDGSQPFVIRFSVLVQRRLPPFDEIIIRSQIQCIQTVYPELNLQTLGEGGLSGGRRARNQDDTFLLSLDPVCDFRHFLLMQRLGNLHQLPETVPHHLLIQIRHIGNFHQTLPPGLLAEGLIKLLLVPVRRQTVRIFHVRKTKQYTPAIGPQLEHLNPAAGRQGTVAGQHMVAVQFRKTDLPVGIHLLHQPETGMVAFPFQNRSGFLRAHINPADRQILFRHPPHSGFHRLSRLLRYRRQPPDFTIKSLIQRIRNLHPGALQFFGAGRQKHQRQRILIGIQRRRRPQVHQFHLHALLQNRIHGHKPVIRHRPKNRVRHPVPFYFPEIHDPGSYADFHRFE